MGDDSVSTEFDTAVRVLFRTRGNHTQGMGDLHGVLALARELEKQGCQISVMAEPDAQAVDFLESVGLGHLRAFGSRKDYGLARSFNPDIVIFNMLRNDPRYISGFRPLARMLVTIDDDGPAAKQADLRINPLYPVNDSLSDISFIFLKKEFRDIHTRNRKWSQQVRRVLVTAGGADTYGFLPITARAAARACRDWNFDVVTGPAFCHHAELEAALSSCAHQGCEVSGSVSDMHERMVRADLIVCGAGMTLFEAACCGTPAVVVCNEPFEEVTAQRMARAGFGINLGFHNPPDLKAVQDAAAALAESPEQRKRMGEIGRKLVDGNGAARTVGAIASRYRRKYLT